jgi:DNA-directed RNA polymerase subunit alpha
VIEYFSDLDKLIMDIETNGTMEAEEAIRHAGAILTDQLSGFVDLQGSRETVAEITETQFDSIRSCCVRSTNWISPFAAPTA